MEFKSLEEIASNYKFLLIDNSALQQILYMKPNKMSLKEKLERHLMIKESLQFWKNKLKHCENCYVTQKILEELIEGHYSYKKAIKRNHVKNPLLTKIRRIIREENMEKNKLYRFFEGEERIINFNKEERDLYRKFYRKYFFLKERYKLSGVDFNLLLAGAVKAYFESSAIISNDFGIVRAWVSFLKSRDDYGKFGFFARKQTSNFWKLKIPKERVSLNQQI